jgi:hypothetical protein
MIDFDVSMKKFTDEKRGMYMRYSDDIILIIPQENSSEMENIIKQSENYLQTQIKKENLNIQNKKTVKRIFKKEKSRLICYDLSDNKSNIQYLGVVFDGKNYDLRGSTWARYYRKLSKVIKSKTHRYLESGEKAYPRRKIYKKFTDYGKNNFITYTKKAKNILNEQSIGTRVSRKKLIKNIKKRIDKEIINQKKNLPPS